MSEQRPADDPSNVRESAGLYEVKARHAAPSPTRGRATAKLFTNGRSQAVRLPKAFRLPGTEVHVYREGTRVVLEPIEDAPRDDNGWALGLWSGLAKLRHQLTDEDFELPEDPPPVPDDCSTPFEAGEGIP